MKICPSRKKKSISFSLVILLAAFLLLISPSMSLAADSSSKDVRITVLYPSVGNVKKLRELQKQQLMPQEKIGVNGVYHENEKADYEKAIRFVHRNKLRWFKFQKLSGEIERETLFQENSLTDEFKRIFNKSDGILFFGGDDIPPGLYGKQTSLMTNTTETPYRHLLELSFLFHILGGFQDEQFKPFLESSPRLPILCICLGMQTLNVATGGTLIQDIPSEVYGIKHWDESLSYDEDTWHQNPYAHFYPEWLTSKSLYEYFLHPIKILKKSKFASDLGFKGKDTPYVISVHHQAVDKLGKGLKVAATSLDGKVVEALEHQEYPNLLGIQFHPDFVELWDQKQEFRLKPDQEKQSLLSILKKNPPSLEFKQKIWTWFFKKAKAYHSR
jgi:putative glutamine amidotransferase